MGRRVYLAQACSRNARACVCGCVVHESGCMYAFDLALFHVRRRRWGGAGAREVVE